MKKFLFFAILIAVFFASCEENEPATSRNVKTSNATEITTNSVILSGEVYVDISLYENVKFGIMMAENEDTLNAREGHIFEASSLLGNDFKLEIKYLSPATKYYYCAWILLNDTQYEFGKTNNFTTEALAGSFIFSVSSTKRVAFSPGNLQYNAGIWCFADSQLDYITKITTGYKDLFAWSGSYSRYDYKFGVNSSVSGYYSGDFLDWGTNIINDFAPNVWRTPTKDEWEYLLKLRSNAANLNGMACVDGINGLIILPDSWTCPSNIKFKPGFYYTSGNSGPEDYAIHQTFTIDQWSKLEQAGAVFLPAAGDKGYQGVMYGVQRDGKYWSATPSGDDRAYYFSFSPSGIYISSSVRFPGLSVRLVRDL